MGTFNIRTRKIIAIPLAICVSKRLGMASQVEQASEMYDLLVDSMVRPPRAQYQIADLGPTDFLVGQVSISRHDFELQGPKGRLQCSHWKPENLMAAPGSDIGKLPCVVYLHPNAGNRTVAPALRNAVLSSGLTFFSLDLSGSGHSDGDRVSLGWYERLDVAAVIEHLRQDGSGVSKIALWGMGSGAVAALLYADYEMTRGDRQVAAIIADSAFQSLQSFSIALIKKEMPKIPTVVLTLALAAIRRSIKKLEEFNIDDLAPIKCAPVGQIPVLFLAAEGDLLFQTDAKKLHDAYGGEKKLILFDGNDISLDKTGVGVNTCLMRSSYFTLFCS